MLSIMMLQYKEQAALQIVPDIGFGSNSLTHVPSSSAVDSWAEDRHTGSQQASSSHA